MTRLSQKIASNQKVLMFGLILIVFLIFIFFAYFFSDNSPAKPTSKVSSDLPLDKVNPQEIWLSKIESENQMIRNQMKYLETLCIENKKLEQQKEFENDSLKIELNRLRSELKTVSETKEREPIPSQISGSAYQDPLFGSAEDGLQSLQPLVLVEVAASSRRDKVHNVNRVVPAGTSVKAVLVSSIDAPCGVSAHSDPQPVKLQILDDGHLPKGVKARLKGGIVIASVYGDLSSERVYMRLERLTQVKGNGEFIETAITGYVTGEDGKFGLRGTVVDKSGKLVENAALSGVFSGLSDYLQAKAGAQWVGPYENGVACAPYGCDLAVTGGVSGTCSAFDMLTDYYIKRAEQIRPVIEVTAGRIVDITFTHGAELGDLYTQDKVRQVREDNRCEG